MKKKFTAMLLAAMTAAVCIPGTAGAVNVSDPTGDGQITISDSIVILSYLSGNYEPINLDAFDFDRNGVISQMDAISVQMYLTNVWKG